MSWRDRHHPEYFFEKDDLPNWYLKVAEMDVNITIYNLMSLWEQPKLERSITLYTTGPLSGLACVKFDAMDAWFEEEEQIFYGPKDPYKVSVKYCQF